MSEITNKQIMEAIVNMGASLAGLGGQIERLRIDLEGVKSDVSELKADVAGLKTDVATLKTDVAVLKTDVAELKRLYHKLDDRLDFVAEKMADIPDRVKTLELNMASAKVVFSH